MEIKSNFKKSNIPIHNPQGALPPLPPNANNKSKESKKKRKKNSYTHNFIDKKKLSIESNFNNNNIKMKKKKIIKMMLKTKITKFKK